MNKTYFELLHEVVQTTTARQQVVEGRCHGDRPIYATRLVVVHAAAPAQVGEPGNCRHSLSRFRIVRGEAAPRDALYDDLPLVGCQQARHEPQGGALTRA